ncbi:MAG: hypothetical protein KGI38_04465 [Thaumarchaeota archaeon]|nr:hypothetical protein [Nitrososphaerota archaeon]
MKTLPTLAAVAIAMALVLSPMMVNAAGSITFSSPASGASYKGSQSYSISGTVSPAPTQPDQVGIVVKNPSGQTVDQDTAAVTSGAFSYATAVGGTSAWTTGTYTITATDSFGATGTTSFTFTSSSTTYNVTAALILLQHQNKEILGNLTAMQQAEATEQKDMKANFTSLSSAISTLQASLTTITSSLTSITNSLTSINTAAGNAATQAGNAATQAQNAANAVASTQTYVLVVAVLAAITLVLELAILVRKLS